MRSFADLAARRSRSAKTGLTLLIGAILVPWMGCGSSDELSPPALHLGEDVCSHCNMILNEEKFVAASIEVSKDGMRTTLLFDDLSCLVDHEKAPDAPQVLARYVHDAQSVNWIPVEAATFVHSESIRSPMGGGVLAVSTGPLVESFSKEYESRPMTFEQVVQLLREGIPDDRP